MEGKLLIVGCPAPEHVGAHVLAGARSLGLDVDLADVRAAFKGPRWLARVNWWLRGRRPNHLHAFSRRIVEQCARERPRWLLATGLAPLTREALLQIGNMGIVRLNYLTDDPWNKAHYASWFMRALPTYDRVFSTRRANLRELSNFGCARVDYLPFAYAPEIHLPVASVTPEWDVIFAGGADRDRVPYMTACIQSGMKVALFGGFWDRYPETRAHHRGIIGPDALRDAYARSRVAPCLVRRANRDGSVMRSYELPALNVCMIAEDTAEHRDLFGAEGECVLYFDTPESMVLKLRRLLDDEAERTRLRAAAHARIVGGAHTYRDRLRTMLES